MFRKINIVFFFSWMVFSAGFAQKDSLFPLHSNPQLFVNTNPVPNSLAFKTVPKINSNGALFFDDFSGQGIYVDPAKWQADSMVFRNDTYPRAPFTIGVATFDGLNKYGYPYNVYAGSLSSAGADTLTSLPIDMTLYTSTDSTMFFSFFYQSRGWGDGPESNDSIVLEFLRTADTTWHRAWSRAGYNLGPDDSTWKFVILPVYDPAYFTNKFQFRFRNRATLSGSFDHWHIDYVYLNPGRNKSDSCFKDIAFGYEAPSLLKDYSAMPWWQWDTSSLASDWATHHPVFIRNNDTTTAATNISVNMRIYGINPKPNPSIYDYPSSGGFFNVPNYKIGGWDSYAPHANPPITFTVSTVLTQPTTFYSEHYITANDLSYDNDQNDTLRQYQDFFNYYAYDDGTAESGYGFLNSFGAEMAVKIKTRVPDTLVAVNIYWDPVGSVLAIQNSTYRVRIWNDNNGVPGSVIYQDSLKYPRYYANKQVNAFVFDTLTSPLALPAGTYYVGIIQTSNQPLNVGFDRNYNHQDKMFYNTSGTWQNSSYTGSYMIRPVMRKLDAFAGIHNQVKEIPRVMIYPNPTKTQVTINHSGIKDGVLVKAELYDVSGRAVLSEMIFNNQSVDVSTLNDGVYFLKISDGKSLLHTTKLFVAH